QREVRAYRFDGFELNLRTRRLKSTDGRNIDLTNGEFNLLAALLAAPQRVLTREQLLDASRVYDNEVYDRSIDVQVLRLRRKIEADPTEPQFILTERGAGYCFNCVVEVLYCPPFRLKHRAGSMTRARYRASAESALMRTHPWLISAAAGLITVVTALAVPNRAHAGPDVRL